MKLYLLWGHPEHVTPCLPVSGRHLLITFILSYWLGQGLEVKPPRGWELNNSGSFYERWFPQQPQCKCLTGGWTCWREIRRAENRYQQAPMLWALRELRMC